ncbi:ATP-grasp domain-containing protein [Anoxybacillus flavithermus]|uniref:ATP-grasp domain-containing protein n=1 Tax=Anoxybacillus flavithermus TaxID=33934 RepID=A0A2G5RP18_9BACL|nr:MULTISPECIES: ATP-grasp domain-containing protein [Anoxybacillus]KFZ43023.1 hypothetical protein JS80_06310 [Anoxybacillus sp. KU2-6(11)]PIC04422.1 ATP-grasp domain-containing protein [Anoxybacillus flavithermus]
MKQILVVNTGDRVHAAALAARSDLKVTFVTEERFVNMYPPNTDIVMVENLNDPSGATKSVVMQRDCNNYEAVVSLSERAAPTAAYLRDFLGLEGPTFDVIMNCTNKYAMKRKFTSDGLPTAAYSLANSLEEVAVAAEKVGWPIIVKPVIGAGTDATMVFHNKDELYLKTGQEYFHRLSNPKTTSEKQFPVIVEHFLNVDMELHCDGYVENGQIVFARVSRYLRPVLDYASDIFGSVMLESDNPLAAEVLDMHNRAVQAVGITNGVTHFEVFLTPKGLLAGEIACRPGGGGIRRMLQLQNGFDSWKAHIAASLGEKYSWESPESVLEGNQIAQLMLPTRRGKVSNISTAEDFAHVPGFIEADIKLKPGDVVDGLLDSSAISGLVFVRIDNYEKIENVIAAVREAFILEVDNPNTKSPSLN